MRVSAHKQTLPLNRPCVSRVRWFVAHRPVDHDVFSATLLYPAPRFPFVSFISEFGRTAATDRFLYGPVRAMEFLNSLLRTYHRLDCMNECPGGECYEDGKQYTISHEAAARLFVITLA